MVTQIFSAALFGIAAKLITVEAEVVSGLSHFTIVGLPDIRIQEARERVRSAIKQSGYKFPYNFRITVNLAPSHVKKEGTGFDLPIALAVLNKELALPNLIDAVFIGELALDGTVRPVNGVVAATQAAKEAGKKNIYVPAGINTQDALLISGIRIIPVQNLRECVEHLTGKSHLPEATSTKPEAVPMEPSVDISEIVGNDFAKRALTIAAAGNYHCLLSGPPGIGKSMLAKSFKDLLPPPDRAEKIEITQIYTASNFDRPFLRPFRSPHHSASATSLLGRWHGSQFKPGEFTLAHRGVLFLDELPEFRRDILEQLRQPLESGEINLSRAEQTISIPMKFVLIATQNPCPCGYLNSKSHECRCSLQQKRLYQKKLSGPLLDRIQIHCDVEPPDLKDFSKTKTNTLTSEKLRKRIIAAQKFSRTNIANAHNLETVVRSFAISAAEKIKLSPRGLQHLFAISRTIADLEESENITKTHIAEALQYRQKTNEYI